MWCHARAVMTYKTLGGTPAGIRMSKGTGVNGENHEEQILGCCHAPVGRSGLTCRRLQADVAVALAVSIGDIVINSG